MEQCGDDYCEPMPPTFDEMAMFFDSLNLNLQLTQEAFDSMQTMDDTDM